MNLCAENERIALATLRIKSGKQTPVGSDGLKNAGPHTFTFQALKDLEARK